MKRGVLSKIFKLGIVFASVYTCLFGYVIHANTVYTVDSADSIMYRVVQEEEVVKEEVHEPVEEKKEEVNEPVPYIEEKSYSISGNTIQVASIYNHLMNDNGDNYYLNHNINGYYDGLGVPYIDFRNDFTGRKTIIYAHSTLSGTGPFNALQNYHNNPWYFQNNRYITVQYNGQTYTYEIFSVYVSLADDDYSDGLEYYYRMNYDDEEWGQVLQQYKNHSEYDTGVSVNATDKIIIFQTCSMDPNYYERYYRYNLLIMGKLI